MNSGKESSKYMAGSSMSYVSNGDNNSNNNNTNSWGNCNAESFSLRVGPDYNKNKMKAPSSKALYEAVGVEYIIYIHI